MPCTERDTFIVRQHLTLAYGPDEAANAGTVYHAFFNRDEISSPFVVAGYELRLDLFFSDYSPLVGHVNGADCTLRTMLFSHA